MGSPPARTPAPRVAALALATLAMGSACLLLPFDTGDDVESIRKPCDTVKDCPGDLEPNGCRTPACVDGACEWIFEPEGTTAATATPGDCRRDECDGEGNVRKAADDTDVPDDGRECTDDGCESGTPTFSLRAAGSACGAPPTWFCSKSGDCVPCKPVDETTCEDTGPGEPTNNTEATAHNLGSISDADSAGGFVCGVLKQAIDVDWYTYAGIDHWLSEVDPTRNLSPEHPARVCAYFECLAGTTTVTCPGGTTPDKSPLGRPGCCSTTAFTVSSDLCGGTSEDDARVFLRVDNPGALACIPYTLRYHY